MTKYDFVSSENLFRLAKIKKDNLWGLLDIDTLKEVVPPKWDREPTFAKDIILFYDNEQLGMGALNHEGKVIIPPRFYDILPQTSDRIIVKTILCFYGLFDGEGNELLPYVYDRIEYKNDDCIIVKPQQQKHGVVNVKGEVKLPFEFGAIWFDSLYGLIRCYKNGKWGVFTSDYKELLPIELDNVNFINNYIIASTGERQTVYDIKGNRIINLVKSERIYPINEKMFIVTRNGKNGIILSNGWVLVDFIYDDIFNLGNDYFLVSKQDEACKDGWNTKWGIINAEGEVVVPVQYGDVRATVGDIVIIRDPSGTGCINIHGKMIVEPKYNTVVYEEGDTYIKVCLFDGSHQAWGLFDLEGNQVTPIVYDWIDTKADEQGMIAVKYKGKSGVVML